MSTDRPTEEKEKPTGPDRAEADVLQRSNDDAAALSAQQWQSEKSPQPATRDKSKETNPVLPSLALDNSAGKEQAKPQKITDKAAKAEAVDALLNEKPEANEALLKAADESVNKSIWRLPRWAKLPSPSSDLGCVSSFSDRYRRALQLEGVIDSPKDAAHRKYYQVNMTDLQSAMGRDGLLQRIDAKDARPGDVVMGLTPGTTTRHMGIVGRVEGGVQQVYDNFAGTWRKESLAGRFDRYPVREYYRAYLPEKKK